MKKDYWKMVVEMLVVAGHVKQERVDQACAILASVGDEQPQTDVLTGAAVLESVIKKAFPKKANHKAARR